MTLLRLEPTRQRRATADSERVSARQARAAPLPPLPDPHAIVPSTLPPLYVIFGRGSPSAAVWSIPHRGYCSSFLINYFRQKSVFHCRRVVCACSAGVPLVHSLINPLSPKNTAGYR